MWEMEKPRHRIHLYRYKQKIQQCKIFLTHISSIQTLKTIPPPLTSSVKSVVSSIQHSGQVPPQGTGEMGRPSTAEGDTAQVDALAAVQ